MKPSNVKKARALANSLYQRCREGVFYNLKIETPKWGYMVFLTPGPVFDNTVSVEPIRVASFINANKPPMDFPLHYFGAHTDKNTGEVYFFLYEQFANEDKALAATKERGALTIWDVVNKKEISLTDKK